MPRRRWGWLAPFTSESIHSQVHLAQTLSFRFIKAEKKTIKRNLHLTFFRVTRNDVIFLLFFVRQLAARWNFSRAFASYMSRPVFTFTSWCRLLLLAFFASFLLFFFHSRLVFFFLSLYWDQNNNPQERNTQKYFRISSDKIAQKIMVSLRQTVHMCLFVSLRFYVFTIEVFARTHKNTEFVCCDTAPNYYV